MNSTDVITHLATHMQILLRYLGAGAAVLLTFGYMSNGGFSFLCVGDAPNDVSIVLVALYIIVAGFSVYTVHRALFYPIISAILLRCLIRCKTTTTSASDLEQDLIRRRIERRSSRDPVQEHVQEHLDNWAAQAHFLYCTSWAITFAAIAAYVLGAPFGRGSIVAALAVVLLVICAVNHDRRNTKEEIHRLSDNSAP